MKVQIMRKELGMLSYTITLLSSHYRFISAKEVTFVQCKCTRTKKLVSAIRMIRVNISNIQFRHDAQKPSTFFWSHYRYRQKCKWAGTHGNGVPVGICAAGTPFLFVSNCLLENTVPPAEHKLAWIFRNAFR